MAHKPNFTAQLSSKKLARLAAEQIGCFQATGPQAGKGSIRQMLNEISCGESLVMMIVCDSANEMRECATRIRALAVSVEQDTYPDNDGALLHGLAAALENAAARKEQCEQ
jgi:hypothetical protein